MQDDRVLEFYQEKSDSQEFDLRNLIDIVRKRLPIIATIAIIVFAWQVMKTYTTTPIYTASSDVLIEKRKGASSLDSQYLGYDPYFFTTQNEIIKSEKVAKRVVENLQLDKKYRKYFLRDTPAKKSFLAEIKKKIKDSVSSIIPFGNNRGKDNSENSQAVSDFNQESYSDADIIADIIRGGIGVIPLPESKIVTITYRHNNPVIAKLIANAAVQAYKDVTLDIKLSATNYELHWMTTKAEEERKKLEEAENALQEYKRENDLVTVEDRLAVIPQKLSQINSEFTKAQTERKELEEVYQQIKEAGNNMSALERIPVFASNTGLQAIREKIFRAKQNIKELSKKYGYKHPTMIQAKDDLVILNNELKFEVDRTIASTKNSYELAEKRERNLKELLSGTKSELLNVNEKFVQLSIMQREVDTNRVLYDALTSSIKKTGVTEQAQSVNIWVVRNAELPGSPSFPNKRRALAFGLIFGLALGVGVAFLLEYLDNTVKSERELSTKFGLTVLGSIEQVKSSKEDFETHVIRQPLSPLTESYRLIRTNLLLSSAEKPPKKILITSMGPKEGKTSTTVNIARVLSQDNKKVLIIDCDLRKPRMHKVFGVDNNVGLSNYLTGNADENVLVDIPNENIRFIPSGQIPPNPAELLSSRKMQMLVKKVDEMFDFVLLDSPPIQRVTDSLALSRIVDGTIVVVRARKTTKDMLFSGMKKLQDVNTHILGFVLNGMKEGASGGGYYAGYNTYYANDSD